MKLFENLKKLPEMWNASEPYYSVRNGRIYIDIGDAKIGWDPTNPVSIKGAQLFVKSRGVASRGGMCSSSCDWPEDDGLPGRDIRADISKIFEGKGAARHKKKYRRPVPGKKVKENNEEEQWGIIMQGGSIGDGPNTPTLIGSQEDAKEAAKRRNKQLTPGEKKYYGIKYKVVKMNEGEYTGFDAWVEAVHANGLELKTNSNGEVQAYDPMAGDIVGHFASSVNLGFLDSWIDESKNINEGNFYECRDCGAAWVPGRVGEDPDRGTLHGTEDNPRVSGSSCPECGSVRVRVEY